MLSPNELEVMELLWTEDSALTRGEIIENSPNRSWKESTIHLLLNSLLKKEAIKVDGFKPSGKIYGRAYAAAITKVEYTAQALKEYLPKDQSTGEIDLVEVFDALVKITPLDKDQIKKLQKALDEKKKTLEK